MQFNGLPACHNRIDLETIYSYTGPVKFLTRQEQMFLAVVLGLLLAGLCVKWYRTAHPSAASAGHQLAK